MIKYIDNKIWGPWGWHIFHCFTLSNIKMTKQNQKLYYKFYKLFGSMLPCFICKNHYHNFFNLSETFNSDELIEWSYNFHENVNKNLGKESNFTLNDFYKKYEFIDSSIVFKYLDLIYLIIPNDLCLIHLNTYINFLRLFMQLYPDDETRKLLSNNIDETYNIISCEDLKNFYIKIKNELPSM